MYESMFGNTERVARAVATGLEEAGVPVRVVDVGVAGPEDLLGCGLLVLGAPTHAFSLSRPATREEAVQRGAAPRRAARGVRDLLGMLDAAYRRRDHRPPVAVYDTRVDRMRHLPGSAARRAGRVLRAQGFDVVARESFYVTDVQGPLAEGETGRARAWGAGLPASLGSGRDRHAS